MQLELPLIYDAQRRADGSILLRPKEIKLPEQDMTTHEAAKFLRLDPKTVWTLGQLGKISGYRPALRNWRWYASSIVAYDQQRRAAGREATA